MNLQFPDLTHDPAAKRSEPFCIVWDSPPFILHPQFSHNVATLEKELQFHHSAI